MEIREKYVQYLKEQKGKGLWEVNGETKEHISVVYQQGKLVSSGADHQTVLYARAGEKAIGYAVSQCIEEEPEALLQQAAQNAEALQAEAGEVECAPAPSQRAVVSDEPKQVLSRAEVLRDAAQQVEARIPSEKKSAGLYEMIHTQWVVNQRGLNRQFSRRRAELSIEADGKGYIVSAPSVEELDISEVLAEIEENKKIQRQPVVCEAGTYRAVLSSDVVANFWITAWQMFSGREYAAGSSALQGRLSQKIASEKVTLQDLPALPGSGYAFPFDCEGSEGIAVDLVRDGRFCGLMHNLETAQKLQAASTGNAGRTIGLVKGSDIVVTPKNFVMQPGQASMERLLSELGDGLYVYSAWDQFHAVNTASGEFSFPCNAAVIRGGVQQGTAYGMTMNGNIRDLLQHVEMVGNRLCYLPLLMHEAYQVAAPALLVSELSVSGNQAASRKEE